MQGMFATRTVLKQSQLPYSLPFFHPCSAKEATFVLDLEDSSFLPTIEACYKQFCEVRFITSVRICFSDPWALALRLLQRDCST